MFGVVFSLVCLGWVVCGVGGMYHVVVCLIVLDCLWVFVVSILCIYVLVISGGIYVFDIAFLTSVFAL